MMKSLFKKGEEGQVIILLALSMIGLLGIVGLAIDGGMMYWNHRRAQNGADAAAIAGTTALVDSLITKGYTCGTVPETAILAQVEKYATNNEVPNGEYEAFYLTKDGAGNRVVLTNSSTGGPWKVGTTGVIPCQKIIGLQVRAHFPQTTFIAGVIGIAETDVTVDAYAIYDYRNWCTDFAMFGIDNSADLNVINLTGSNISVTNGGMHSNGGMHLSGSSISLETGRPVEYGTDAPTNIGAFIGGPDGAGGGTTGVDSYPLPDDAYYRFDDFAPANTSLGRPSNGFIWNETDPTMRYYYTGSIGKADVTRSDGTLKDGLYVVEGDVQLQNIKTVSPWRVTIVAKGSVQVSGGISTLPFTRGLFVYSLSNNTSNGAVKLSGSSNHWAGLIYAPNGDFNTSGARNSDLSGMIIARRIDFSGSNNSINHRPEYCPVNPPRVLLTS